MIAYLKNNDLVDAQADQSEIAGFLAKQISAKNGYEFYALLRDESEAGGAESNIQAQSADKKDKNKKS
jgi:hypothetical protein